MTSEHVRNDVRNGVQVCKDIEDGQTRLSVLQNYTRDKYTWEGRKYSELTEEERNTFNCYEVRVEVIKKTRQMSEETFNSEIHKIFERLNSGRPLSGNDKYHLYRSSSPVIMFALELKDSPEFRDYFKKYIGKIGEGKSRSLLSDTVGCVLALTRTDTSRADCINTSYERNCRYIHNDISEESRKNAIGFFRFYFALLDDALTSVTTPKKCYGKLSGVLGLLVYGWIQDMEHGEDEYDTWKSFITSSLVRGYSDTLFNTLRPGDRRNLTPSSLKIRWELVLESYVQYQGPREVQPRRIILEFDDSDDSDDSDDNEIDDNVKGDTRYKKYLPKTNGGSGVRTEMNRKDYPALLPHRLKLRATTKAGKNLDLIFSKKSQTFWGLFDGTEYKILQEANRVYCGVEYANKRLGNAWEDFKALNLDTGKKRSIRTLADYNWFENLSEEEKRNYITPETPENFPDEDEDEEEEVEVELEDDSDDTGDSSSSDTE
jgi:hypothetical protein